MCFRAGEQLKFALFFQSRSITMGLAHFLVRSMICAALRSYTPNEYHSGPQSVIEWNYI